MVFEQNKNAVFYVNDVYFFVHSTNRLVTVFPRETWKQLRSNWKLAIACTWSWRIAFVAWIVFLKCVILVTKKGDQFFFVFFLFLLNPTIIVLSGVHLRHARLQHPNDDFLPAQRAALLPKLLVAEHPVDHTDHDVLSVGAGWADFFAVKSARNRMCNKNSILDMRKYIFIKHWHFVPSADS
jgi:hypothetical protein